MQEVMIMRLMYRAIPLAMLVLTLFSLNAEAWRRSPSTTFATLPAGAAHPEGITADVAGNVYVTTFDVSKSSGPGQLFVFDSSGRLLTQVSVAGSSNLLLGLDFHPATGALLVIDFGKQQVLAVNPATGASSVFTTIPGSAAAGPNALTFDSAGNVYISDSFQGIIWRTGPAGGPPTPWVTISLLTTSGVPPFGANGLAFNKGQTALLVANTGNDTVVKIPVSGSPLVAGTPFVFVNSVNGADGLIIDDQDRIWVAANQADEIVVLDPTNGRVVAKLGDFDGIAPDGAPNGLLFPASLVLHGNFLYVTNLSLDLGTALGDSAKRTVDSPWAAQVTRHTVAKIPAHIPPIQGLP
jgi:sugar lactone lactonase YvrE